MRSQASSLSAQRSHARAKRSRSSRVARPCSTARSPNGDFVSRSAHDLPHQETNERFVRDGFPQVQLAYDGLSFEVYA